MKINPNSAAGQFLISQGVSESALAGTSFRVLNAQFGDALTVVWPFKGTTVFIKSRFLERDGSGEIPVARNLGLIRHELHHAEQGSDWGFIGYWTRHLWARVKHLDLMAKESSVEAPAYELQRKAYAALDQLSSQVPG